ncbi:FliH/SctL family protein [Clostridium massiliamazoniense]|uniref:FliH/SctL family protein n=1 Tax=Clostridium massiliamazoniense TaxID=1347366 RepID=UPI0006D8307A|nr:FliH/SctL family protein [Clostridium massiliamazoniense]
MQSSYSVIKSGNLYSGNLVKVNTIYENKKHIEECFKAESIKNENMNESFKNLGENLLKQAREEKENILKDAYDKAVKIEKETYEKAYKEGLANGVEDGYKEAYEKNIERALEEAEVIRNEAIAMLHRAKVDYEEYLSAKSEEILKLSYNIVSHILNENIGSEYGVNKFIENVLKDSKDSKSFVIRVNEIHRLPLEEELARWKLEFSLKGEVFILEDNSLKEGNAIVEMEKGKVEVGIDKALESIKNEIFS